MPPTIQLQKSGNGAEGLRQALERLSRCDVLVGIPQNKNSREGEKVGNAELLYILSHGSPVRGIPARPVIEPAIKADGNRQPISEQLNLAVQAMLQGDVKGVERYLKLAGVVASNACKAWFLDSRNNWAPNKPATIKAKGSDKPLIDTGSLRKAITYVVRQVR